MSRFFITPEQFDSHKPIITGPDVKHMTKVLRLRTGDAIDLLDGTGRGANAVIEHIGKDEVHCQKVGPFTPGGEPPVDVILVQGLAKGDKMDLIIQKSTELGVSGIIPLISQRTVVRVEQDRVSGKHSRWQRVAMEAAKQCRRARIPVVYSPCNLGEVLKKIPPDGFSLLPWEGERIVPLKRALPEDSPGKVYLFIGPEGGFEASEVEEAANHGVVSVSLGPRILRTETAGMTCLSILMHKYGDLG
ncbi:MAG: 16S rRNA (uracil(1498)-N(3))-methyltransferase [Bacillota bacterium]